MITSRLNVVLFVIFAVVVILAARSQVDYSRPNIEILPDMKYTPAWTAYEKNPVFPNGRTLQAPVHGTIARGELPLHFLATKEDAVRAGEELMNPYAPAPREGSDSTSTADEETEEAAADRERLSQSISRGSDVYRVFCVSCHGPTGTGDGPVPKRGFPPPPSMLTGNSLKMKDGQLFHILTYGQGSMSSFAAQLPRKRRWDVVNYVRSLQPPIPSPDATAKGVINETSPDEPATQPTGENDAQ